MNITQIDGPDEHGNITVVLPPEIARELRANLLNQNLPSSLVPLRDGLVDLLSPSLDRWLEKTLGGPPEMMNAQNIDHFSIVVDVLSLMKLAGPRWQIVAAKFNKPPKPPGMLTENQTFGAHPGATARYNGPPQSAESLPQPPYIQH